MYKFCPRCHKLMGEECSYCKLMDGRMKRYLTREVWHTAAAVAITAAVAVAAELSGIKSFSDVSIAGLAVTGVRTAASAIVVLGSRFIVK